MKISQATPTPAIASSRTSALPKNEDQGYLLDTAEIDFSLAYARQEADRMSIEAAKGHQLAVRGLLGLMATSGVMLIGHGLSGTIPGGSFLPVVAALSATAMGAGFVKKEYFSAAAENLNRQAAELRPFSSRGGRREI